MVIYETQFLYFRCSAKKRGDGQGSNPLINNNKNSLPKLAQNDLLMPVYAFLSTNHKTQQKMDINAFNSIFFHPWRKKIGLSLHHFDSFNQIGFHFK